MIGGGKAGWLARGRCLRAAEPTPSMARVAARFAAGLVLVGLVGVTAACAAQAGKHGQVSVAVRVARSAGWSTVRAPAVGLGVGTSGVVITGDAALVGLSFGAALNSQGGPVSCVNPVPTAGYTVAGRLAGPLPAPRPLGFNIDAGPVAGGGAAVALISTPGQLTPDCGTPESLRLADLRASGGLSGRVVLQQDALIGGAAISSNPRGDVAAAWLVDVGSAYGGGRVTLRLFVQPSRARAGRIVDVLTQPSPQPGIGGDAVAIDRQGGVLIAYSTLRAIYAVNVTRDGIVGRQQALGPCNTGCRVAAAETPDGRAVVVWDSQQITGDGAASPYVVRAAFRDASNVNFAPARVVDPGGIVDDQQAAPPAVAIAPNGRADR
jgi:hypothetical protein